MVLVGPPGPICGALVEGPTELDSLEQPARSTRGAKSRNIRASGSFFCNIPFVRNMSDEWLYCSDIQKLHALLDSSRALLAGPKRPRITNIGI
jgi:hypothetical protein